MAETSTPIHARRRLSTYQIVQIVLGIAIVLFVGWRLFGVLFIERIYGLDSWAKFLVNGLILGGVYALIAIGYTLVYGILRMINFAHGDIFMVGCFAGYFVFNGLDVVVVNPATGLTALNAYPILSVILAFAAGITVSAITAFLTERVAYRPLRGAPRLVPLISAIGVSLFLENLFQLIFGPQRRAYTNPELLDPHKAIIWMVAGQPVSISYTGIFTFVLALLMLAGLYVIVQRTKLGRSMRAVAEDKQTAALMGIDVNQVIGQTFVISGALAGAAGVMFGIHYQYLYFYTGFIPGIKAFTAAVLGGIGNLPGALLGSLLIGLVESGGPSVLGIDLQLKDVIAFSILVLVLIFRPSGILGEVLSQEKL
jgi:branched-chain amino acid transport system permease protein